MLKSWRERIRVAVAYARQGKGIAIPYTGRNRYKPGPKWFDEIGNDWERFLKTRTKAKMNNRDRHMRGSIE